MSETATVFIAIILTVIGGAAYIRDTLRGTTKPNRVTWLLWGLAPFVVFLGQRQSHAGITGLFTLTIALVPLAILAASFVNKQAYWSLGAFDVICGGVSLVALVLLIVTKDGLLAIFLGTLADFMAALPTFRKAYLYPETETVTIYALGIVTAGLVIANDAAGSVQRVGFAWYILFMNVAFTVLITRHRLRRRLSKDN